MVRNRLLLFLITLALSTTVCSASARTIAIPSLHAENFATAESSIKATNYIYQAFDASDTEIIQKKKVVECFKNLKIELANIDTDNLAMASFLTEADYILFGTAKISNGRFTCNLKLYSSASNTICFSRSYQTNGEMGLQKMALQVVKDVEKAANSVPEEKEVFSEILPPAKIRCRAVKNRIVLRWHRPGKSIAGFKIYRAQNEQGPFRFLAESTSASFTDRKVEGGKTYFYKIKSAGSNGTESPDSPIAKITTKKGPDSPVIVDIDPFYQHLKVSVIPAPTADKKKIKKINIYRETEDDYELISQQDFKLTYENQSTGKQEILISVTGDDTCANLSATMVDKGGQESEFSSSQEGCTVAPGVTAAVKDELIRKNIITITHEDPKAQKYIIYRQSDEDNEEIAQLNASSINRELTYTDENLDDDTTYHYTIRKVDKNGHSCKNTSEPLTAHTHGAPSSPAKSAFTCKDGLAKRIECSYQRPDNDNIRQVEVCLKDSDDDTEMDCMIKGFFNPKVTFDDLQNGKEYFVKLRYINKVEVPGEFSSPVRVTTKSVPDPVAIIDANDFDDQVLISWEQSEIDELAGYHIEINGRGFSDTIKKVSKSETSLTLKDLKPGPYCFRILVIDTDGLESDFSDQKCVRVNKTDTDN